MESLNNIIMSHYDELPHEIQYHIEHFIPYRQPPQDYQIEYKIFCQDWKNQTQARQWTGIDPNLYFDQDEVVFLNRAYFKHQYIKKFYDVKSSTEEGITYTKKLFPLKTRRNTI